MQYTIVQCDYSRCVLHANKGLRDAPLWSQVPPDPRQVVRYVGVDPRHTDATFCGAVGDYSDQRHGGLRQRVALEGPTYQIQYTCVGTVQ